jgi:DNA-binding response OmpR family regulator
MKILVAEDDAVCRRFLEIILQRLGHTVKACADGYQAWRAYEAEDFNVVVSDWMMPVLDGLDLCRTIRKLNRSDYCYFIMSTSRDSSADILEAKTPA